MAYRYVLSYQVRWDSSSKAGVIDLTLMGGGGSQDKTESGRLTIDDCCEMQLLVDLLRNEGPIWYDTAAGTLTTGQEMPGEGE